MRIGVLGLALAVAALGSGCAYHAGRASAEKFDAWVADHPIRGARIVDTVGTDEYAFVGELTAYARLTAEPTAESIGAAMSDLCDFDDVARTPTTYWLQVEHISMQVICSAEGRARLIGFYDATSALPGLDIVFLDRTGVEGKATDEAVPLVAGPVFAAADASGTVDDGATYVFDSDHVHVESAPGVDLTAELAAARDVLPVVGDAVEKVTVGAGLVVAGTTGTVPEVRRWQGAVTAADPVVLLVTPDRVSSSAPLTARARDLVERLSTDDRVTLVSTYADHWAVDVTEVAGARSLLDDLGAEPATADLGPLTLSRVVEPERCNVSPVFPSDGAAEALLDLCARDDMPTVDGRFDTLDVRTTGDDLTAVLVAAHAQVDGTAVSIDSEGAQTSGHYSFTTGPTLTFDQDFDSNTELERIWATLG